MLPLPRTPAGLPLIVLAACAFAGCGRDQPGPAPAQGPPETATRQPGTPSAAGGSFSYNAYTYDCGAMRVIVAPGDRQMTVYLPDRSFVLPQIEAASGARYAEGDDGFWGKGINTGILTLDGENVNCRLDRAETPWDAARLRQVSFRAVGQDPGWLLEISPERMELEYGQGETRLVTPNPGRRSDGTGTVTWAAQGQTPGLTVEARRQACVDPDTGQQQPATVEIRLDGRQLAGCGRFLD